MNRHCPGDHQHCRLEGSLRGFQVHRATYMENYQPAMASTLAAAMATPEAPRNWEHGYAVQEITEHVGKLVELHVEGQVCCPSSCAEASQEPWTSLNGIFGRTFELQTPEVQALMFFKLLVPMFAQHVTLAKSDHFNQRLQADVFWIKDGDTQFAVLSCVDSATMY